MAIFMGGNFPGGSFSGGSFPGGNFPGWQFPGPQQLPPPNNFRPPISHSSGTQPSHQTANFIIQQQFNNAYDWLFD